MTIDLAFESEEFLKNWKAITDGKTDQMYLYDEKRGIWLNDEVSILNWIRKFSDRRHQQRITKAALYEIYDKIKRRTYSFQDPFDTTTTLKIALANGTYDFETGKLETHNMDNRLLVHIPVDYVTTSKCKAFDKFLSEVIDKEQVHTIMEMIGYTLYPTNKHDMAFMFIGDGSNGKTVLTTIIERLLTRDNVSNEELQELQNGRFSVARLHGRMANIAGDISAEHMKETNIIKKMIDGSMMAGEFKHANRFDFRPRAKLINSCNELPSTRDKSFAWYRRWMIINFPNTFTNVKEDRDRLIASLTTSTELKGILFKSLQAFKDLEKRGRFEDVIDAKQKEFAYISQSDPAEYFLKTRTIHNNGKFTTTNDLYSAYTKFCADMNKTPMIRSTFIRDYVNKITWTTKRSKTIKGKQVPVWLDMELRPENTPIIIDSYDSYHEEREAVTKSHVRILKSWKIKPSSTPPEEDQEMAELDNR